jgi:hypothetical protein
MAESDCAMAACDGCGWETHGRKALVQVRALVHSKRGLRHSVFSVEDVDGGGPRR